MTKEQITQVLYVTTAVADTIRGLSAESPLGGVPSGELYAHLMGHLNYEQYTAIINLLKRAKLVSESNHLLVWIGPMDCGHRSPGWKES